MSGNAPPTSVKEIILLIVLLILDTIWSLIKYPFKKFGGK